MDPITFVNFVLFIDDSTETKETLHKILKESLLHNWNSFSQIVEKMDNLSQ
jgi:hypothetical protein